MKRPDRTYSSPDLKGTPSPGPHSGWYSSDVMEEDDFYVIGDRVYVDDYKPASVAYFGEVDHAAGDWVGVVLDEPIGQHNGRIHGREYFQCAPRHGLLVRTRRVRRIPDSIHGSNTKSSRGTTPLPSYLDQFIESFGGRSLSSTPGSYFYDEDYRLENAPTVASLGRKLESLEKRRQSKHQDNLNKSRLNELRAYSIESLDRRDTPTTRGEFTSYQNDNNSSRSPVFNFRPQREPLTNYYPQQIYENLAAPDGHRGKISIDLSSVPPNKGDRVLVRTSRGEVPAILRYIGETEFATGEWAGVELDRAEGKNDGSVLGHRYFHCPKDYGLFVPAVRIRTLRDRTPVPPPRDRSSSDLFKSMRSTIYSPPPKLNAGPFSSANYQRSSSIESKYTGSPYSSTTSPVDVSRSASSDYHDSYPKVDWMSRLSSSKNSSDLKSKYNTQTSTESFKFDDGDLDVQLKKSLQRPKPIIFPQQEYEPAKPCAVKYTFTSSKYNGSPIAWRTVEYN